MIPAEVLASEEERTCILLAWVLLGDAGGRGLRKLELLCPSSVMSTINRPRLQDLLMEFFSCPLDALETQWRNVGSAGFSHEQPIDAFWLEVVRCWKEPLLPGFSTWCDQASHFAHI